MAHVAAWKKTLVDELVQLMTEKPVVAIVDVHGIGGQQIQSRSAGLRGHAVVKMTKNNLILLALEKAAESKPEPAAEPEAEPAPEKAVESSGVVYGVQVLATSKKMKPTDAFFKGYTPLEVRSGKLYKYILVAGDDLAAVRKKKKELDKKFPGCFLVSKDGETVTRIP